jgi:uncharacterized protein (TIRG00374 family)
LKTALKIIVSVLLIALLVRGMDIEGLTARLIGVDPLAMLAAVLITLAVSVLHAARWMIVIQAHGARMPFPQALQIVLIGYFFNQVLPSSMGGDAMRVWRAHRAGLSIANAMNTVILDRVTALAALVVITIAGWPWLANILQDPLALWGLILVMLLAASGLVILTLLDRMPKAFLRWRLARGISRLSVGARAIFLTPRYAIPAIMLSVSAQLMGGVVLFILARGIDVRIGLVECLLLIPPVILFTMVPISIAGWGVREGAMVVIFGFAGVTADNALAASVLTGFAVLLASLPGGLVWLAVGSQRRTEGRAPPS